MRNSGSLLVSLLAVAMAAAPAAAIDLRGLAGGALDPGSLGSATAGNAAGVIEFCVRNNYLDKDAVGTMKERLLGKLGVAPETEPEEPGYRDGLKGLLDTGGDRPVDLNALGDARLADAKKKVTRKACSSILSHAKSLL